MRRLHQSFSASSRADNDGDEDEHAAILKHPLTAHAPHRMPSLDTLIISGRTRYPSDKEQPPRPDLVDLNVAANLLSRMPGCRTPGFDNDYSCALPRAAHSWNFAQRLDSDKQNESPSIVNHTRRASGQSFASDLASTLSSTDLPARDTSIYLEQYNLLAKKHGITTIDAAEGEIGTTTDAASAQQKQKGFWNRFSHATPHAHEVDGRTRPVTRKASFGSLVKKRSRLALDCCSLDELYRFGGVSVVALPPAYSSCRLVLPIPFAATINHLILKGPQTPGLFRIPGQTAIVNVLYDHFISQIRKTQKEDPKVEMAVGTPSIPNTCDFGIHDVASVFKKLLWDIPGGILGSLSLLKSLREVEGLSASRGRSDLTPSQARMAALSILSLRSSKRISLICAVFGLLALVKNDAVLESTTSTDLGSVPSRRPGSEAMSSRALAVVFAPVLLGSLTENIPVAVEENQSAKADKAAKRAGTSFFSHIRAPRAAKSSRSSASDRSPEMNANIERNDIATSVLVMMIGHWTKVVFQMKAIERFQNCKTRSSSTSRLELANGPRHRFSKSTGDAPAADLWGIKEVWPTPESYEKPKEALGTVHNPVPRQPLFGPKSHRSSKDNLQTPAGARPQINDQKPISRSGNSLEQPKFAEDKAWWLEPQRQAEWASLQPPADPENHPAMRDVSDYCENAMLTANCDPKPDRIRVAAPPDRPNNLTPSVCDDDGKVRDQRGEKQPRQSSTFDDNRIEGARQLSPQPQVTENPSKLRTFFRDSSSRSSLLHDSGDGLEDCSNTRLLPARPVNGNVAATTGGLDPAPIAVNRTRLSPSPQAGRAWDTFSLGESAEGSRPSAPIPRLSPSRIPIPASRAGSYTPSSLSTCPSSRSRTSFSSHQKPLPPLPISPTQAPPRGKKKQSAWPRISPAQIPLPESSPSAAPASARAVRAKSPLQFWQGSSTEPATAAELPICRRIDFNQEENVPLTWPLPSSDDLSSVVLQKGNVGTLFAEIRRLQVELDARNETIVQLQQQLTAMRHTKDTAMIRDKLREALRDARAWRSRAELAEARLQRQSDSSRSNSTAAFEPWQARLGEL